MVIPEILELNQRAVQQAKAYVKKRFAHETVLAQSGKHFIALIGPRGSGKTVLLKQLINEFPQAVYISLDALIIDDLYGTLKELKERYNFQIFLLDEIHNAKNYEQDLKKAYDFLDIRVIFTSSVALSLYESTYDLSRRVSIIFLHSFSIREYLYFKEDILLPTLTIQQIHEQKWTSEHLKFGYLFEPYLQGGLLPFALDEPNVMSLLGNILTTIISKDIPLISSIKLEETNIIAKMVQFIGMAQVDGISYSSLSQNLNISKYKAEQYVTLLEKAFVLRAIFPNGTNVLKEPKILMCLPFRLLYKDYAIAIGGLREDFFIEMMAQKNSQIYYLKTNRGKKTPDYYIETMDNNWVIEIGGKGKGREKFKGIDLKKSIILSHSNDFHGINRPLYLAGF